MGVLALERWVGYKASCPMERLSPWSSLAHTWPCIDGIELSSGRHAATSHPGLRSTCNCRSRGKADVRCRECATGSNFQDEPSSGHDPIDGGTWHGCAKSKARGVAKPTPSRHDSRNRRERSRSILKPNVKKTRLEDGQGACLILVASREAQCLEEGACCRAEDSTGWLQLLHARETALRPGGGSSGRRPGGVFWPYHVAPSPVSKSDRP